MNEESRNWKKTLGAIADSFGQPLVAVLISLLLGAVVSCGIIVLLYLFDDQIRDEEYVRQTFDLPLLAAVPDLTGKNSGNYYYKNTSGKEARS